MGKRERGKRGGNRGRKPAKQRVLETAHDRTELWSRGETAEARKQAPGTPMRMQVRQLTLALDGAFRQLREDRAGDVPRHVHQPETMFEDNLRRRKTKLPQWRGE